MEGFQVASFLAVHVCLVLPLSRERRTESLHVKSEVGIGRVPNKPTVSVDVKQHSTNRLRARAHTHTHTLYIYIYMGGGGGVAVDNEINKAVRLSNIFHSRQKIKSKNTGMVFTFSHPRGLVSGLSPFLAQIRFNCSALPRYGFPGYAWARVS